jgi:hypothetical protein
MQNRHGKGASILTRKAERWRKTARVETIFANPEGQGLPEIAQ